MAFKWTNLVDGKDYVTAEPINEMGQEVEKLSEEMSKTKVLFVTITDGVASHTPTEIVEYVNQGHNVYFRPYNDDFAVALTSYSDNTVRFAYVDTEELFSYQWVLYDDGSYEGFERQIVPLDYLEEFIGDIDKALDELHNYAQSLINGGDAV